MGYLLFLAQVAFVGMLIYIIIKEIREYRKKRRAYFYDGWNILELAIIFWSIVAIGMYVGRYLIARDTLRKYKKDTTQFLNFQHVAIYDEVFNVLMGFLVFFYTARLLRVFRYTIQSLNSIVHIR